ncbi:hypothetical protein [Corynebacterium crudilactis]|uniref:Uncharacterized protein n=1 Tax=Corynebacterium crudilactis TaxID=1652495 RepID=A0A172QXH0_9CORY|nr:hypothetical protein [Corynebacterium crudilactis]ANE05330.1 hypothetical protein ccrud_07475 [Corynebacterium crudilactis]
MEIRANVYSPLQNTAVRLGAWLYDLVPIEDVIEAFVDLGGPHTFRDGGLLDLLRTIKELTSTLIDAPFDGPILTLALSGPGQVPALPAGSRAAQLASASKEGALVLGGVDKHHAWALIPDRGTNATAWDLLEVEGFRPMLTAVSPGEADQLLSQATEQSARIIQSSGYASLAPKSLQNPRLTVGMLSDFYDTPGLPFAVPPRSAKLFARADRVAAIAETVQGIIGDHSLDPQLISLWSHIRTARMAGVNYALAEFARDYHS